MSCLITKDKIRESIIDNVMSSAVGSGLFERTGPTSLSPVGTVTKAHTDAINQANAVYQDSVISFSGENQVSVKPSQELVEAYESKMAPEIALQNEQITSGERTVANPQTVNRITDFLNRVGVDVQAVNEIVVDGRKMNAAGVALPLQSLILHMTGTEQGVLAEEAMHIGVELLSQKNPELYNEMDKRIVDFPVYREVFREYGQLEAYQKDGRPNISKLKREAIGKLLSQVYSEQETNPKAKSLWSRFKQWLGQLFSPFRQQMQEFNAGLDGILNEDLGTVRDTLLQSPEYLFEQGFTEEEVARIVNLAQSMMTDLELRAALADIAPKLIYMKATPTVERRAKGVLDGQAKITEAGGQTLWNGKAVKGTDITIAVRKLAEKLGKSKPQYQSFEDALTGNTASESHLAVRDVLRQYLDAEGFPKTVTVESMLTGKSAQYEAIARAVVDKINSFPTGTKFLTEVKIADRNAAAVVDLIAIDPSETFNLINYQQVELNRGEQLEGPMVEALRSKMEAARDILARGYNVSKFGETRTMLVNVREEKGVEITEATLAKTPAMDYLAPIPTASETLGSRTLDAIYAEMYNVDTKRRVVTGRKTERDLQNNKTLTGLLSSFRALQINRTVYPLSTQIENLAHRMESLSARYENEIKGKPIGNKSPIIKQFIEDMAIYMTIGENLKKVQSGVAEINANSPGSIDSSDMARLGRVTRELNEAFATLNRQSNDLIDSFVAQPNGIRDINEPELIQNWLARGTRTSSMSSQATIQLLHKIASEGQHRAELRHNDFMKNLSKMKKSYEEYMKKKGLTAKDALKPITQKGADNNYVHKLVEKVSRDFFDQAKVALKNKDLSWVKENIDMKAYDEWFQAQKTDQFAFIEASTYAREDQDIQALIDKYKEEWLDRYDLSRGLHESNTKIYNFPVESKFLSEDYKKLLTADNKPALELYNMMQDLNQNAIDSGVLDAFIGKTFIPFRNKSALDDMIFGRGLAADKARKDFFQDGEEFYQYGEYTPNSTSKRKIPFHMIQDIAKRHVNEKGEVVVDYSNVSTDIFDLLGAYNFQTETYRNYSDIESASQLLVALEKTKDSKATDKTSGKAIEGGGYVENIHNLQTLEQFVLAEVYGKKYQDMDLNGVLSLSFNSARALMNRKFGTNFDTEKKEIKVPVRAVLDWSRNFFIFKALGFNPATAIVNFLGTNMQASIDAGQFFTKAQFMKNNYKMFSEKLMGRMSQKEKTSLLGAVDFFIPIIDNESNQGLQRQMSFNKLSKLDLGHTLMSLLRWSDLPVQWSVAASYLENTIIDNGELVNVREYLKGRDKYVKMFESTEAEKKRLMQEFEQEAVDLINKQGLLKNIEFDAEGYAGIKGIERDSDTVIKLRERLQQISKNATGMGTNNEYRMFNSTLVGRNLMTFFSWAPRLIDKRYQSLRYVTALDQMEWGRIRTFGNYISKAMTESGTSLVDLYKVTEKGVESLKQEFQKQVEKYEANTGKHYYERGENEERNRSVAERDFIQMYQRNIQQQTQEFLMLAAMFGLLLAISAMAPDDDEEAKGVHKYASKIARKALSEISFFYNPFSVIDVTNGKLLPGAALVTDVTKLFSAMGKELFGDEEQKEKAHPLGRALKLVPGLSQLAPAMALFDQEVAKELDYQLPDVSVQEPTHNN